MGERGEQTLPKAASRMRPFRGVHILQTVPKYRGSVQMTDPPHGAQYTETASHPTIGKDPLMPRSLDLCQAAAGLMDQSVVRPTLLPTPGSDVGADTIPIPTHLKPGPHLHPPISSLALYCQRSDLAPATPQACPEQRDMPRPRGDREHLAGSPGTSSPTSLPGMDQL